MNHKKFENEFKNIGADFADGVAFLEVSQVDRAIDLLTNFKSILQDADQMADF